MLGSWKQLNGSEEVNKSVLPWVVIGDLDNGAKDRSPDIQEV